MAERERHVDTGTVVRRRAALERPRRYRVMLHNDDYTTMDFVVEVLTRHFHHSPGEAVRRMLEVHREGSTVGGVYSREVAETKVVLVSNEARQRGMPLLVTTEPEDEASPG